MSVVTISILKSTLAFRLLRSHHTPSWTLPDLFQIRGFLPTPPAPGPPYNPLFSAIPTSLHFPSPDQHSAAFSLFQMPLDISSPLFTIKTIPPPWDGHIHSKNLPPPWDSHFSHIFTAPLHIQQVLLESTMGQTLLQKA